MRLSMSSAVKRSCHLLDGHFEKLSIAGLIVPLFLKRNSNEAKPIANAGFGFDMFGIVWIRLNLLPEVSDIDTQVVGPLFRIGPPNFPEDLAVGQNFPCVLNE